MSNLPDQVTDYYQYFQQFLTLHRVKYQIQIAYICSQNYFLEIEDIFVDLHFYLQTQDLLQTLYANLDLLANILNSYKIRLDHREFLSLMDYLYEWLGVTNSLR